MPAMTKAEATARMYALAGEPVQPLGPGSKEKRSAFEALGRALGLDLVEVRSKTECGRQIAARLDISWDPTCYSAGDTITLVGLNRVLDAAERAVLDGSTDMISQPDLPPMAEIKESVMSTISAYDGIEEDPRTVIEEALAEQLVLLSSFVDTPDDVRVPDGDFETADWLERVRLVQGWLRFETKLSGSRQQLLEGLVANLGFSSTDECLVATDDGSGRLNVEALDRLKSRAEQAADFADKFKAELEKEGGTLAAATGTWADLWVESAQEEIAHPEPIAAKTDIWSITDFVVKAKKGQLNLIPSYQRSDVWPVKDRQLLIISILRGIPLPAVILTKPKEPGKPYEVVDGKQRLTSILRFTGQHPKALAKVAEFSDKYAKEGKDFTELFRSNYPKFRIAWKSLSGEDLTAAEEAKNYFPFRLPTDGKLLPQTLQGLKGKYYCEIRDEHIQVGDDLVELSSVFEETSAYKIPIIEYSRVTPRQVHEVFHLYNRQGKQLNPEEIRNAIYHELDLTRALLATAGDTEGEKPWEGVADFLEPIWSDLDDVGTTLREYGFGVARYKRTKVLSWVVAMLAFEGSRSRGMSTAKLIDSLLDRIQLNDSDRLRDQKAIQDLLALVARAMAAHAGTDPWAAKFKDGEKGTKWLELGLVGSITGVALAASVHQDFKQRLKDNRDELLALSASKAWDRPENAQSANQIDYIAKVARETATVLGASKEQVALALGNLIGVSGAEALWSEAAGGKSPE